MLNNIKVLIPRPVGAAEEFANKLTALGATPIIFPLIKVEAINKDKVKEAHNATKFDWIILTSSVAVQFFFNVVKTDTITAKIAVVGTATKKEVEKLGLKIDFIASAATAKKLVKEIPLEGGETILIPRSKIAGKAVIEILTKRGAKVTEIATYSNTPIKYSKEEVEKLLAQEIDVISFTSGSTVDSFMSLIKAYKIKLENEKLVSIGPSTTSMIEKLYFEADATAEEHNIDGLIATIVQLYQ